MFLFPRKFWFPKTVYFGGRPGIHDFMAEKWRSPDACIKSAFLGKYSIDLSDPDSCNFITGCGQKHEPGIFFPGPENAYSHHKVKNSYAELANVYSANGQLDFSFSFRLTDQYATLVSSGAIRQSATDELRIRVHQGFVQTNIGSRHFYSTKTVCDGQWHRISITIDPINSVYKVVLDSDQKLITPNVMVPKKGGMEFEKPKWYLDEKAGITSSLILGGYLNEKGTVNSDFRGCVKDLNIDSNVHWRWNTRYMIGESNCPIPDI